MFTSHQWQRIEELFHASLDLAPDARIAFLNERCPADPPVRTEVLRLLSNAEDVGEALEPPAPVPDSHRLANRRIGAYRLVRPVSSGGMGTVWLGQRADEQFTQTVAVKLITCGLVNRDVRRYFLREQRTLARLEHPYITRLIDGGVSDEGWPYLVMEYVEGVALDVYCNANRLGIAERLNLFRMVCEAVHYAHQQLIVHRDLKPTNILVQENGKPKLLDFGISKILDASDGSGEVEATQTLLRVMTPQYASPEQVRSLPITTATDVYSLGLVLYEILSGHRPYTLAGHTALEWERVVCDAATPAPSAMVERMNGQDNGRMAAGRAHASLLASQLGGARQLSRHLRGDLDNIVLKAIHKDAGRRYASVMELYEDVNRYLNQLPVSARGDSLRYRARKFLRRNGKAVGAAMALMVTLVAGIGATTAALNQARSERDVAVKVTDFMEEVFYLATPFRQGRDRSVLGFLGSAGEHVETELVHEPAVAARAHMAIARTYERVWRWRDAAEHARKSLQLYEYLLGDDDPKTAEAQRVAGRAMAFAQQPESVALLEESLAHHRNLFGDADARTATAMSGLALALWEGRRPAQWERATALYREAIAAYRGDPTTEPRDLALALSEFAMMLVTEGKFTDECEASFDEAISIFESETIPRSRSSTECYRAFALYLMRRGRFADEASALRKYLESTPAFFETYHMVLNATWRLAELEAKEGRLDEALRRYREVLATECTIRIWHNKEATHALQKQRANIRSSQTRGQLVDQAHHLLVMRRDLQSPDDVRLLRHLVDFALYVLNEGHVERVDALLTELAAQRAEFFPEATGLDAYIQVAQGASALRAGDYLKARSILIPPMDFLRRLGPPWDRIKANAMTVMADLYDSLGEPNKSAHYLDRRDGLFAAFN